MARETREKIWAKARELGYQPDVFSAALASKAHSRAAEFKGCPLISLHQPSFTWQPMLRADMLERAQELCKERGFILRRHIIAPHERPKELARRFYDQGVQGILFGSARGDISWFDEFPTDHFCIINVAGRLSHMPYPSVRSDVFEVMRTFYRLAVEKGYQRIGAALFLHDPDHPDDQHLRGAFLQAQREFRGMTDDAWLFDIPQRTLEPRESVHPRFLRWIEDQKPDALFLFGQEQYEWLRELPDNGGVKGVVLQTFGESTPGLPSFARVNSHWWRVAEIAVQWLENAIRLRHYGPQQLPPHALVESEILPGDSFPDL